jgi:membrane complex biogenesis BtpA family protein
MPALIKQLFKVSKPVIAMAHLPALPGTPRYNAEKGLDGILEVVSKDLQVLLAGGVDGVLFCNEDDRPYSFHAGLESVAVMTRVVSELKPSKVPYGVDFLWDPLAALAIAKATGAAFMREVISGVYESDMGLWQPDAAALFRYRKEIDAQNVRVFANITPEFASPLGERSVYQRARSVVVSTEPDAVLISGSMAGSHPDISLLEEARSALGDETPLFLNTGAKADNIKDYLSVADGVIVGSSLKHDGYTWNPVDPARVEQFMSQVMDIRRIIK